MYSYINVRFSQVTSLTLPPNPPVKTPSTSLRASLGVVQSCGSESSKSKENRQNFIQKRDLFVNNNDEIKR